MCLAFDQVHHSKSLASAHVFALHHPSLLCDLLSLVRDPSRLLHDPPRLTSMLLQFVLVLV